MSSESNKAVVRRIFEEAFNENKPELAEQLFHPEYVDHNPIPGQPPGAAAGRFIAEYLNRRGGGGGARITIEEIVAESDIVAVRWTAGRAAPGAEPSVEALLMLRLRDGKVCERWAAFNRAEARSG